MLLHAPLQLHIIRDSSSTATMNTASYRDAICVSTVRKYQLKRKCPRLKPNERGGGTAQPQCSAKHRPSSTPGLAVPMDTVLYCDGCVRVLPKPVAVLACPLPPMSVTQAQVTCRGNANISDMQPLWYS